MVVPMTIEMERSNTQFISLAREHRKAALKGHSKRCFNFGSVVVTQVQRIQASLNSEENEACSDKLSEGNVLRPLSVRAGRCRIPSPLEVLNECSNSNLEPARRAFVQLPASLVKIL